MAKKLNKNKEKEKKPTKEKKDSLKQNNPKKSKRKTNQESRTKTKKQNKKKSSNNVKIDEKINNRDNIKEDNIVQIIKLESNDHKIFEVPINILNKIKLISGILELTDKYDKAILLKEVDAKNLERIIDYLKHYKDMEPKEIPKPFPERTDDKFFRSLLNDDWTFDFLQSLTIEDAINLVNASNYLQIEGLINLLAAKCAHEMCNCEIEEARQKFGIECDMTEEEVAEYDKYPLD